MLTRNFMLCAFLAGFVGILEAVRSSSATPDPSGANQILFQAISAAVIGGTLLQGGSGTVVGAFIGAIFLGVLQDGLIIKGVSANYFLFYLGLAITDRDGVQHLRRTRADGVWPWLTSLTEKIVAPAARRRRRPARRAHRQELRPDQSPCATSTCTCARARCSGCWGTTAPASQP